jgi:predicted metalloenzyme YecM
MFIFGRFSEITKDFNSFCDNSRKFKILIKLNVGGNKFNHLKLSCDNSSIETFPSIR